MKTGKLKTKAILVIKGKKHRLAGEYPFKRDAQLFAEGIEKPGKSVVFVKTAYGYAVYVPMIGK